MCVNDKHALTCCKQTQKVAIDKSFNTFVAYQKSAIHPQENDFPLACSDDFVLTADIPKIVLCIVRKDQFQCLF